MADLARGLISAGPRTYRRKDRYMDARGFGRDAICVSVMAALAGCGAAASEGQVTPLTTAVNRATTDRKSFGFTGLEQTFMVPTGVSLIKVVAYGAAGCCGRKLPKGGRTQATVTVTPGETLYVFVGGAGAPTTGGFNGGGNGCPVSDGHSNGGGGASDVRQGGDGLVNRIVVAGGGGGDGFDVLHGGRGGGLTGGTGHGPAHAQRGQGGSGGTQSQGGAGGNGGDYDGFPGSA